MNKTPGTAKAKPTKPRARKAAANKTATKPPLKEKRRPCRPGKQGAGFDTAKGGLALANGLLEAIPANTANGAGNPKLVLKASTIETIQDRMLAGEKLKDVLDDMGIAHRLFWDRKRDTPEMGEKIEAAKEGACFYEIEDTREISQGAFDRDSAAAAKVKMDGAFKRAQMLAPKAFRPELKATQVSVTLNFEATLLAARERAFAQRGIIIEHDAGE